MVVWPTGMHLPACFGFHSAQVLAIPEISMLQNGQFPPNQESCVVKGSTFESQTVMNCLPFHFRFGAKKSGNGYMFVTTGESFCPKP
ncbi:MAG: hypothetical protein JJ891_09055 [Rhizobiaceae bacterium]|nr:hypothetical protein [Rhizobiaceae bacterium]